MMVFFQELIQLKLPALFREIKQRSNENNLQEELSKRNVEVILPLRDTEKLIGFIALSEKILVTPFLNEDLGVLTVLTNQFVTALTTARFYTEALEKRRMEEELSLARQIQQNLLPKELPDNEVFQIAAYSEPSLTVGGDLYDYLPIDQNRFGLVIADASGKGMPAALLISQIQAIVKSEVSHGDSIQQTMINLNNHVKQYTSSQTFTTFFYGIFDTAAGTFEYANAGHNYPIVLRKDGTIELLITTGPALGIIPYCNHVSQKVTIHKGDCILFYSDGVTETMNAAMNEYGEQRLRDVLVQNRDSCAQDIIQCMIKDLNSYNSSESLQDDRTIMIVKVLKM